MSDSDSYVLATAAYNEGKYIEGTVVSIISQELRPAKWVIVSDGSTDDTDAIVMRYAAEHSFIHLYRLSEDHPRNFAAQANAINTGIAQLQNEPYAFIGNLDADITLHPSYFRALLDKFDRNPGLGLAGGAIHDKCKDGEFRARKTNSVDSVAHAVQLFRRECFEAVGGGYKALPYGGPDTYAEILARMKGWQVVSFPELTVFHHRPTNSAGGRLQGRFRQGRMDFSLGVSPLFEAVKILNRLTDPPYVIAALARLAGFIYPHFTGDKRAVSDQFMAYLRSEQNHRLVSILKLRARH